ncbi:MAG TPA: ABC transporter permease subunit [Longimicrobiales bacterium]
MRAADVRTVMWKELREQADVFTGGSRAQLLGIGFVAIFFGVISPLRGGAGWFTNGAGLFSYAFVGTVLLMQPVADVFAGERERHTLETLLSTRLNDASILLGKLFGVLLPVWLLTLLVYVVAIVATNIEYGHGQLLLPPAWSVLTTLAAIVLVPGLIACIGVFVSMRSDTVRKAAQVLSFIVMGIFFLPLILSEVLPRDLRARVLLLLNDSSPRSLGLVVAAALLVIEVGLIAVALARFRRGRMALD